MAISILPPIFVFWDELLTFESVEAAERWLEPWCCEEEIRAYDSDGVALHIHPENPLHGGVRISILDPLANKAEMVALIRERLLGIAEARPDLIEMTWVENATLRELLEWCWKYRKS